MRQAAPRHVAGRATIIILIDGHTRQHAGSRTRLRSVDGGNKQAGTGMGTGTGAQMRRR